MEVPIIPICKPIAALIVGLVAAAPAVASVSHSSSKSAGLSTYVEARSAEIQGDELRSARLYAAMAKADPANVAIARRAMVLALQSGDYPLAVSLAKRIPTDQLGFDGRTLLAIDLLRARKTIDAVALMKQGKTGTETDLFAPLMEAWAATGARRDDGVASLAALPRDAMLYPVSALQRANMLIALGKRAEAIKSVAEAVNGKGSGYTRQRIELAAGLQRLGEKDAALATLAGDDGPLIRARSMINAGKELPLAVDTPAKGMGELLLSLAADLSRGQGDRGLPLSLARLASYADPANASGSILTALFLDEMGRSEDAIATLRAIPANDIYAGDALDVEARVLSRSGRDKEALARVQGLANSEGAALSDLTRLADVLGELDRHQEAAQVYGRALEAAKASGATTNLWTLHLLRASSLEEIDRWPEAKVELASALVAAPDNPIILNFLGYGKLERGEDLDQAEAMIRKASALRPDDASITDSLGWALFKRGNLTESIDTLRRAAAGDPAQSEIHEHLGDALYKAGRRIEARFSWSAALSTADEKQKPRLQAKLESGLDLANAAP